MIFNEIEISTQILDISSSIKFHENPSILHPSCPMRIDGRTSDEQ